MLVYVHVKQITMRMNHYAGIYINAIRVFRGYCSVFTIA